MWKPVIISLDYIICVGDEHRLNFIKVYKNTKNSIHVHVIQNYSFRKEVSNNNYFQLEHSCDMLNTKWACTSFI